MATSPSAFTGDSTTSNDHVTEPAPDYLLSVLDSGASDAARTAWRRWAAATYLIALMDAYGPVPGYLELRALRPHPLDGKNRSLQERAFFRLDQFNAPQPGIRDTVLREIWQWIELFNSQRWGVYAGVFPRLNNYNAHKEFIPCGNLTWLEMDFKTQSVSDTQNAIGRFHPEMTVLSGNGVHCYLWTTQFLNFTRPPVREAFEKGLAGVHRFYGSDKTHDVTRILRVPGTFNWKDPWHPKEVVLKTYRACHAYKEPK